MNTRLKELRKSLSLTQSEFGAKIHKSLQAIQYYEAGKRQLSDSMISLICQTFNVNENWLRTGDGKKYTNVGNVVKTGETSFAGENSFIVPYYSMVQAAAGYGVDVFTEQVDGMLNMPTKLFKNKGLGNIHCIKASGTSMYPRINDGDFVFVDIADNDLKTEGIYVIRVDNTLLIKHVQWTPEGLRLISENKEYEPILLSADRFENNNVAIIGKVVGIFSSY